MTILIILCGFFLLDLWLLRKNYKLIVFNKEFSIKIRNECQKIDNEEARAIKGIPEIIKTVNDKINEITAASLRILNIWVPIVGGIAGGTAGIIAMLLFSSEPNLSPELLLLLSFGQSAVIIDFSKVGKRYKDLELFVLDISKRIQIIKNTEILNQFFANLQNIRDKTNA
jgi:hypothetical protein